MRNVNPGNKNAIGNKGGGFYLNYEECKFLKLIPIKISHSCFILTMRNVNLGKGQYKR